MARILHSNEVMDRNPRDSFLPTLLSALAFALILCPGTRAVAARVDLQPCSNHVSPAQQIAIGHKVARQVYQQMPVLPDDSEVTRYVQSLGGKLAAYTPGYKWPFNFHVVNVEDINAFALPGGTVFVNLGTIQAAEDEAQLAAVMAHEMSHVALQHSICNMEKEQHVGLLAGLGQLAAGIALGGGVLGNIAQNTIGLGAGLDFLHMSRGAEKQADLEGVQILYDAGYDPRAMPQFFEIIEGKYGKGGAQFLSDHPNPGNRTDYIDAEIAKFPPRQRNITQSDEFRHIHDVVKGMRAYTAKEVASGKWKREGPNAMVKTGIQPYDATAASATSVNLAPPASWSTFHGVGFTMQVPSTWRVLGDADSGMIAPPGGIGQTENGKLGNLMYGVLTDVTMTDAGTPPDQQFAALLSDLSSDNPGLQPASVTTIQVAGWNVQSADNVNPQANGGRGEHDWIVGFPGKDGLRYFVFVAPEPDFAAMRSTFDRILHSVRME